MVTVILRWTCGAAVYWALPAWLASMTQLPAALKVTVLPDTVHTLAPLDEATENTTGLPEPPPVADKCAEDSTVPDVPSTPALPSPLAPPSAPKPPRPSPELKVEHQ